MPLRDRKTAIASRNKLPAGRSVSKTRAARETRKARGRGEKPQREAKRNAKSEPRPRKPIEKRAEKPAHRSRTTSDAKVPGRRDRKPRAAGPVRPPRDHRRKAGPEPAQGRSSRQASVRSGQHSAHGRPGASSPSNMYNDMNRRSAELDRMQRQDHMNAAVRHQSMLNRIDRRSGRVSQHHSQHGSQVGAPAYNPVPQQWGQPGPYGQPAPHQPAQHQPAYGAPNPYYSAAPAPSQQANPWAAQQGYIPQQPSMQNPYL